MLESGDYELRVRFTAQGRTDSASALVFARDSWRVAQTRGSDGKRYFLTFAEPQRPNVGLPEARTHNAVFGHGSEGNIAPVYRENGIYDGKIGFNMTSDWHIDISAKQGNFLLLETFFFFYFVANCLSYSHHTVILYEA